MERQQYCVYNQTSECFLSLGVSLGDRPLRRLKGILGLGARKVDEGSWLIRPKNLSTIGFFSSRDLIYLDENHRVVHAIASSPAFGAAPLRKDAASVLSLPENTISSSQTQQGNQLLICAAEEMEFRLRSMPNSLHEELSVSELAAVTGDSSQNWPQQGLTDERRGGRRCRWPRLIAYNGAEGTIAVHGVKDISANGLYLVTDERWPPDSEVSVTLQRTDGLDDGPKKPIHLRLKVMRWGKDGVALSFIQP